MNENKFLKIYDVIEITKLSKSSIYRMIKENNFPKQVKLSTRSSAWSKSEIYDWVDEKIKFRQ